MENFVNKIFNEDCLDTMSRMPANFVDLVITSPPYGDIRDYKGYSFNFEQIAKSLYKVIKKGGVLVWVVGDQTIDKGETGISFYQTLFFKKIGFTLNDTMIYLKPGFSSPQFSLRYAQVFEYMFVFYKDYLATFNPIKDRFKTNFNYTKNSSKRQKDGSIKMMYSKDRTEYHPQEPYGYRYNVWSITPQYNKHPAPFPEKLAKDHIISWSNENEIVYDPMCGSGTTLAMAKLTNRLWVGSEISAQYCQMAIDRIRHIVNIQHSPLHGIKKFLK